jgi:S1-C subfamily serine protease
MAKIGGFGATSAALVALSMVLQGCARPPEASPPASAAAATTPLDKVSSIKINGVAYATPAAALEALRQNSAKLVDGLAGEADPLKGRALIVIPDHDRLRPLAAQQGLMLFKRQVIGEALDYNIEMERQNIRVMADALVKSRTFEASTIVEQNDTRNPEIGDADYLVWYQVRTLLADNTGAWIGHWLVRRAGSEATAGAAMDPGVPAGTARYASFAKSVREGLQRLGGTSVAGAAGTQTSGGKGKRTISSGTGIIVDTQGRVVTNDHVVRNCGTLQVTDAANTSHAVTVAAHDSVNDLAVLTAAHHWPQAATLRDGHDLRPGESVVVTGYPLSGIVGSSMAVTTGSLTALAGPRDDSRLLQVSAPVQPGNSGGPLLDSGGGVIGVVTGTLNGMVLAVATGTIPQNVNFAIKTAVLRNFLDTNGIHYASAAAKHEIPAADIGELARRFTVRVECLG